MLALGDATNRCGLLQRGWETQSHVLTGGGGGTDTGGGKVGIGGASGQTPLGTTLYSLPQASTWHQVGTQEPMALLPLPKNPKTRPGQGGFGSGWPPLTDYPPLPLQR